MLAGTLFRLSEELGIKALEMFGFWSLVAIGVLFARAGGRDQVRVAWERLRAQVDGLSKDYVVVREGESPRAIIGPGGVLVLATDDVAQYSRGPLVRARLRRAVAGVESLAGGVRRLAGGVVGRDVPVRGVLVLLRRRVTAEENYGIERARLVNPENLSLLVTELGHPTVLNEVERRQLAGAVTRHLGDLGSVDHVIEK